jgi:hypothetical protein
LNHLTRPCAMTRTFPSGRTPVVVFRSPEGVAARNSRQNKNAARTGSPRGVCLALVSKDELPNLELTRTSKECRTRCTSGQSIRSAEDGALITRTSGVLLASRLRSPDALFGNGRVCPKYARLERIPDHSSTLQRTIAARFFVSGRGVPDFPEIWHEHRSSNEPGLLVLGLTRRATRSRIRVSSVSDLEPYFFSLGVPRKRSESKMKFWPEGSIMTWILSLSF